MKSYIYRLYVIDKRTSIIIKTFLGNDKNVMFERFEKWFIKSTFEGTRNDIDLMFNEVQHVGY